MKNIVVMTYGDPRNPSTWSNVPYLFVNTFEKKKYNVICCDISTKRNIFMLLYTLFFKIIKPSSTYYFVRSNINRKLVNKRIKKIVQKYDDSAYFYFCFGYDFSPSEYTNKKVILFSDWPIEYAIERRFNRKPDYFEKKDIERHEKIIEDATYRISLFKDVTQYMNKRFKNKTLYLGNLINSFYPINGFDSVEGRNKITFIGKKSYYDSAKNLVKAFCLLEEDIVTKNNLELHIIGMQKSDFPNVANDQIHFHGYLNKGKKEDMEEYYKTLKETLVIVNTSDKWAGMSSIIESMYYYKPIITSKYDEYVKTFGNDISFGYYSNNNVEDIKLNLEKIINMDKKSYKKMCKKSHDAVKDFTYDTYVDKIIELVKND